MRKSAAALAGALIAACIAAGEARAQQDEYVWSADVYEGNAYLAYALPESDDIVLVLACRNEDKATELTFFEEIEGAEPGEPVIIELAVGDQIHSLDGITATDEMSGYTYGQAEGFEIKPVLTLLREAGEIAVSAGGGSRSLPEAGRKEAMAAFAEACTFD